MNLEDDEKEDEILFLEPRFDRVISLDPGIDNLGLAIFDSEWRLIHSVQVSLPKAQKGEVNRLTRLLHKTERTRWVEHVGEFLQTFWIDHVFKFVQGYVYARSRILWVTEENDLPITKDFAGVWQGFLRGRSLSIYTGGWEFHTVLPRQVIRHQHKLGLPRKSTRSMKKAWTKKWVRNWNGNTRDFDADEADAVFNALYLKERFGW